MTTKQLIKTQNSSHLTIFFLNCLNLTNFKKIKKKFRKDKTSRESLFTFYKSCEKIHFNLTIFFRLSERKLS